MTPDYLDKIDELADAASVDQPAPWHYKERNGVAYIYDGNDDAIFCDQDYYPYVATREGLEYIASVNPKVVKAFTASIRSMHQENKQLREEIESLRHYILEGLKAYER